jgi:hypothetical protein
MLISWCRFLFSSFYFTPKFLTSQNQFSSQIYTTQQAVKKMEPQITQITQINKKFFRGGPDASRGQFFQKAPPLVA